MSEAENSFEKIEFEQSSGSSTNDQESGDLTGSHQHSRSESSASTMASSTNQVKTVQLEDLEFELAWKTRNEIICNLNQHSELLSGLIVKADAREKMQKANGDLMTTLLNVPLKAGGRLRSLQSPGPSTDGPNEVTLDLNLDVKSRIVDTLITNHHIGLLEADSVASECKAKLIDQNNDLICELVKLKSRIVSSPSRTTNLSVTASKANSANEEEKLGEPDNSQRTDRNVDATLQLPVEQPVTDQAAGSSSQQEMLEKVNVQIAELGKQIGDQASVIGSLEKNVRGLKRKLDESKGVDFCRNEAKFTFELKGINALLVGDSRNERRSELFYCRGEFG